MSARSELPTGTVTFLFTDIEGSTKLLNELGDAYAEALAQHRRVLRDAFARHGGVEVDTQGDAFFVAFATAKDALAAARDGQQALDGPIRVRIGVHTGEPLVTEEGYVGIDVHRAARIAAVGHGGQVLVSQSTRDLVGSGLRDLGEHRLKDLTAARRHRLPAAEKPQRHQSARRLDRARGTGARAGRDRRAADRLRAPRDADGDGRDRQDAARSPSCGRGRGDAFDGGVFFVPLAGVQQPDLVPSTIARTVGVDRLQDLRDRDALLLLDNFEHLLDAAPVVSEFLARARRPKVLTTSRAPLRIEGERECAVEPLPAGEAVELLAERARAVRPDFEPDAATEEICRRLDGLPLALELAAPRLRSLSSAALLERLDRRLPVLTAGRRDVPERQRTLRATIEWSYDLLTPELQRSFARVAVFATFTLEAAEAVADASFDAIDALVEASLLKPIRDDRFLMLETIRELGLERLDASGEADAIRRRHAEFFVGLAHSANLTIEATGPMQHQLVIPEHNNVRAALAWAVDAGEGELGLRLVLALENFWVTADPVEGARWVEALLPLAPAPPNELHAHALRSLGNCYTMAADLARGEDFYEQSLAEYRELGDERRAGVVLDRLASRRLHRGEIDQAAELLTEALATHRRTGFKKAESNSLGLLASIEKRRGHHRRALELYDESLALARETGFIWWEKNLLLFRCEVLLDLGDPRRGRASAQEGLEIAQRIGDRGSVLWGLVLIAQAAAQTGNHEEAGRLWGAIEADLERAPHPGWDEEDEAIGMTLARAGADFERGRAAGRGLALDAVVEDALSLTS